MRVGPLRLLLPALGLCLMSAACSPGGTGDAIGAVEPVRGTVTLIRDEQNQLVGAEEPVHAGDVIEVSGGSRGRILLDGGGEVELLESRLELTGRSSFDLLAGSVLVTAGELDVAALGVQTDVGNGEVRFDLEESLRVGAYEVDGLRVSAGDTVELPSYWQSVYDADGSISTAGPLQYSRQDPIDRRLLAQALAIDSQLGNLLLGLEAQVAAAAGTPVVAHLVDEGVDSGVVEAFPASPRSDMLAALAFAKQPTDLLSADLSERFAQLLFLRRLGAGWGLLGQQFGLNGDSILSTLDREIEAVLFPPAEDVPRGQELVPRPAPPLPAPPPPPAQPPPSSPPPAPPAPEPEPEESPVPVLDPLRPLLPDELERIIDELFGLVDELVPIL